jgi:NADH dehydrogenase
VLAAQLQAEGYSVLLPTSHLAAGRELRMLPKVHLEDADVHDFDELQSLCARINPAGAVINLVGVLHDKPAMPYGKVFKAAHVDLPKNIITAMQMHGLKRYLHMSALGADSHGPSMYQRSKGDGESAVKTSTLDWTIFRPSVIFGAQDQFINLFTKLTKLFPVMPLANHQAKFQPVSVDDIASSFKMALKMPQTIHESYDLVGPKVYTMKEIVEFAARKAKTSCAIIPVPAFVGYLQALAFEFLPVPTLMSRDNIASMQLPNVLPVSGRDALSEVFKMSRRSLEGMK